MSTAAGSAHQEVAALDNLLLDAVAATDGHLVAVGVVADVVMVARLIVEDVVDDDILGVEDVNQAGPVFRHVATHVPAEGRHGGRSSAGLIQAVGGN